MRIAIACNDTRGGVQPYVALARGLKAAGHHVQAVAPSDLAPMFTAEGVPVVALTGSIEERLRSSGGEATQGMLSTMRFAAREMRGVTESWTRDALGGCEGADLVTGGVGGLAVALSVAEKLGLPFVESHLQPLGAPTADYPGVLFPGTPRWLGGWATRLSHKLTEMAVWMPFEGAMQSAREQVLGLSGKPTAHLKQPVFYALSRHVVPIPVSKERVRHVTGYWTLESPDWSPPPALEAFLSRSGPVVSIGFGSMAGEDPEGLTRLVSAAVEDAGVRAVLLSGWGGLKDVAGDHLYCADAVPHDRFFPRVSGIVHHGGAGTTGAALRSGVPSLVVPFLMDQPFWGARTAALGAGPAPIPLKKLTRAALATALRRLVEDEAMRAAARGLGQKLQAENGVATAVELFGRLDLRA